MTKDVHERIRELVARHLASQEVPLKVPPPRPFDEADPEFAAEIRASVRARPTQFADGARQLETFGPEEWKTRDDLEFALQEALLTILDWAQESRTAYFSMSQAEAQGVLLLLWLLTDREADVSRPVVTRLQTLPWIRGVTSGKGEKHWKGRKEHAEAFLTPTLFRIGRAARAKLGPESNLKPVDRMFLERLFEMEGGYVLSFSNTTFENFVRDRTG